MTEAHDGQTADQKADSVFGRARSALAAQRERNARLRKEAERIVGIATGGDDELPIPLAMVPANTRELTALPASSRRSFLERLEAAIRRVFVDASAAPLSRSPDELSATRLSSGEPVDASAMTSILRRSCATCRGKCCTAGADHAFLRDDTVERVRSEQPSLDAAGMLATYASYLPTHHYQGSCVFHTVDGCNLPRTLRSSLCNRYECGGLTQLRSALSGNDDPTVYVAAADAFSLQRVALVKASEARPVALN